MNVRTSAVSGRDEPGLETRRALAVLFVPIFFVLGFALCVIGTYHKPHPNNIKVGVKVGVVGPPR